MEARGALYIPTYEYNYKVITGRDTILQEYYIPYRLRCENTKRYTIMNSTKGAHELQKEKLERRAEGLEGLGLRRLTDDPCHHCTTLISNRENPQASNSGIWT